MDSKVNNELRWPKSYFCICGLPLNDFGYDMSDISVPRVSATASCPLGNVPV